MSNARYEEDAGMNVRIKLEKQNDVIYEGVHAATDAEEFGAAFKAVWVALHSRRIEQSTSVGELMSRLAEDVLDDVDGSTILIERLDC
jgi:hypothetical protein